ncbi:protein-tyrosine-phosphatase [Pilimelia terevasa]|uniref:protein-tyrosine-phosphatase n=1 Tax=Pilimelia terevasa TaxID=53372 RepID=A0A8J3BRH5_9ACTN|nr:low molecular weight phosphatase family protein [Pilimelia terevasa]GGK29924.1 protein-tyrosine-phosphatase [Pilimelia terevasa]
MARQFHILVVCRANLCRSPMAERLTAGILRDRTAGRRHGLAVASAGTHARDGAAMHPHATETLRTHGLVDGDFRSRRLTPELLHRAQLVLTASRAHRAECARLAPAAVGRTFTLLQFARLAAVLPADELGEEADPGERLHRLVGAVPRLRAQAAPRMPEDDDLRDPVTGPLADFAACADRIRTAVEEFATVIAPR